MFHHAPHANRASGRSGRLEGHEALVAWGRVVVQAAGGLTRFVLFGAQQHEAAGVNPIRPPMRPMPGNLSD